MTTATKETFKTWGGREVSFEKLLREPKFLAWRPDHSRARDLDGNLGLMPDTSKPVLAEAESDYTCAQLGRFWGWHRDTIFKFFENYPGVIKVQSLETKSKRAYTSIRIPPAEAARWRREHTVK
jgi:hypothetical protein